LRSDELPFQTQEPQVGCRSFRRQAARFERIQVISIFFAFISFFFSIYFTHLIALEQESFRLTVSGEKGSATSFKGGIARTATRATSSTK